MSKDTWKSLFPSYFEQQLWHVQFSIFIFLLQSISWSSFIEKSRNKLFAKEKRYTGQSFWKQSIHMRWIAEQDVPRW